jgi:Rho GTPase-activating protein 39
MGSSSRELRVRIRCFLFLNTCLMEKLPSRLPPSENGEWWEIGDESRGGIPYYYHTKTGETVWDKPEGFVIPLTVLQVRPFTVLNSLRLKTVTHHQNTALGRRLSKSFPTSTDQAPPSRATAQEQRPAAQRSRSYSKENRGHAHAPGRLQSSASSPAVTTTKKSPNANAPPVRRNHAADSHYTTPTRLAPALPPIPGSEASAPPTPTPSYRDFVPSRSPPQSLNAAVERIARTPSQSPGNASGVSKKSSESGYASAPESTHAKLKVRVESPDRKRVPTASVRPSPTTPTKGPTVAGKEIGRPVLNMGACGVTAD